MHMAKKPVENLTPYSRMATILAGYSFVCLPHSRLNILLNFKFKNETTGVNLQKNKRILQWRPFWHEECMETCYGILKKFDVKLIIWRE